jgi:hypothetical protein
LESIAFLMVDRFDPKSGRSWLDRSPATGALLIQVNSFAGWS